MTDLFSVNVVAGKDVLTYFIPVEDLDVVKRVLQQFEEPEGE